LPEGVIPRAKWKLNVRKYKTPQALEKDYFYQNELKQSIVEDVGIYPNIIHELRFLLMKYSLLFLSTYEEKQDICSFWGSNLN
jgi:hypothetical protein